MVQSGVSILNSLIHDENDLSWGKKVEGFYRFWGT